MPQISPTSGNVSRLQPIAEREIQIDVPEVPVQETSKIATDMILLGISTVSKRALVALGNIFTIFAALSAFFLWYSALPAPTTQQLIGLSLYGAFLLALEVIIRRK